MKYSAKNFAELLAKSSLTLEEKEDIIKILPSLTESQIDEIFITLKEDVSSQEKVWEMADEEADVICEKMELKIETEES